MHQHPVSITLLHRYDEEGDWFITDRLKELIKVLAVNFGWFKKKFSSKLKI